MKLLPLLLLLAGCTTREVIRIQKVPVIQKVREEAIILVPVPTPMKPPTMKPHPSEYWA